MSDPTGESSHSQSRPGLQRPQVELGWRDRQRQAWQLRRESWQGKATTRRNGAPVRSPEEIGVDPFYGDPSDSRGGVFTALIAVGAAMLALGSLWAWQTWSQRSSEPIDDLLPVLASSGAAQAEATVPDLANNQAPTFAPPQSRAESAVQLDDQDRVLEPDRAEQVIVHVSGAVRDPGIVELDQGARVFEAVAAAGGATARADLDRVNLAAPLGDGERIHLPHVGQAELPVVVQPEPPRSTGASGEVDNEPVVVDINVADVQELQDLPGVGPSLAQAIVRTRDARGPFLAVEELLEVPGIGNAKLAALSSFAAVVVPPG